jgi:hypothetical protein
MCRHGTSLLVPYHSIGTIYSYRILLLNIVHFVPVRYSTKMNMGNLASVLSLNISVVDPSWITNPEPGGQLFTDPTRIWILDSTWTLFWQMKEYAIR